MLTKNCKDFFIKSLVLPTLDYFNLSHMYQETADPEELEPMLDLEAQDTSAKSKIKQIPKKVHLIWLGSDLPEPYKQNLKTWVKHKEDYELNLWIDSAALPLEAVAAIVENIRSFCRAHVIILHDVAFMPEFKEHVSQSFYNDWLNGDDKLFTEHKRWIGGGDKVYCFAADTLRLLILYLYGGIYSDIDTTISQPLATLANNTGLFVWGSMGDKSGPNFVDNCVIASTAFNPILTKTLDQMQVNYANVMICTKDDKGVNQDDKAWMTLVYNRRRFNDVENDGRRAPNFSGIIFVKVAREEIERAYGKQGIKDGIIERNVTIMHEAQKTWQAGRTTIGRKRKGTQTTTTPNTERLTKELAIARGQPRLI